MGELGERLRAAREGKGLTLERMAEETRIPLGYLQALESESFDRFSSELHARGFLRTAASYLGLDPAEAVDLYGRLRAQPRPRLKPKPAAPQAAEAARPATDSSPRAAGDRPAGPGRFSTWALDALLALVVLALVAMAGLTVYQVRFRQAATPTPGPAATVTVTPMPVYEGTAYTLDVTLDYAGRKLVAQERIDYTNATSETLTNVVLNVHPNHTRNAFKLESVQVDLDGELTRPETSLLDVILRVELPRELQPDEHVAIVLKFALNLPQISANAEFSEAGFGYSKRAVSLGNWYPVLAPYREDKGWYGLKYFQIGDPYVTEVADYRVTITGTQDVTIVGTGQENRTGNVWRYQAARARSFAFAASDRYVASTTQAGDTTVIVYSFPGNEAAAEAVLQASSRSLALFGELYGPYPYSTYRVAETEFAGGMEFSGLTFLGAAFFDGYDGTTRNSLIPLTAHEVAHQWFYGLVGNDQLAEPWLDEALTEYSSFLYYERYLPADVDWWWLSEVDQYVPTGRIDSFIYEFRDNRGYLDAVYRRGAQFVRDLRTTMSDPAFFAFLREYQRRNAYRLVKAQDFFLLVQEFTTADLVPLQEEYFRQRVLP